jgi:hypothetical protein
MKLRLPLANSAIVKSPRAAVKERASILRPTGDIGCVFCREQGDFAERLAIRLISLFGFFVASGL